MVQRWRLLWAVRQAPCTSGAISNARQSRASGNWIDLPASAYTKEARERIYQLLKEKAQVVLAAGRSVIVDAVYAGEEQRRDIETAAVGLGIPFHGLWLEADRDALMARVTERRTDASDATPETVEASCGPRWVRYRLRGSLSMPAVTAGRDACVQLHRISVLSQCYGRTLELRKR